MLNSAANGPKLDLAAHQLGECLAIPEEQSRKKLNRLLQQHGREWKDFMDSIGKKSFIAEWTPGVWS
jgi:hypothetical protein